MITPICTCGHSYQTHVGSFGACGNCSCPQVKVSIKPDKPTGPPNVPAPVPPPRRALPKFPSRLTKAYVGGTFDLLHPGHVWLLERVKAHVDIVVVSLNTDEFNERYKDRYPIMFLQERMKMIRALRVVDGVMINEHGEDSKPGVLAAARIGNPGKQHWPVTHVAHGADWRGGPLMEQLQFTPEWVDEHGIEMLYIDLSEAINTTSIRQRVIDSRTEDE